MKECQWEDLMVRVTRAEARKRKMKRATVRGFVVAIMVAFAVLGFVLGFFFSMLAQHGSVSVWWQLSEIEKRNFGFWEVGAFQEASRACCAREAWS
jgi:type VI protein secretion system component VasF